MQRLFKELGKRLLLILHPFDFLSFRTKLFLLSLFFIFLVTGIILYLNRNVSVYENISDPTQIRVESVTDQAVRSALELYQQDQAQGMTFTNGPCLSNDLMPNWVVDIAHNPRQKIDDLPANQCQAYLEGRAKHFVEIDPQGRVLSVH